MAAGDITFTASGPYDPNDGAIKTLMDTLSTGAATAGADTTSYHFVACRDGKVMIYKIVRAAA